MPKVYSMLAGAEVDDSSEMWRHECECRWLLNNKPTRTDKHLHLYGVHDRNQLLEYNPKTGRQELVANPAQIWLTKMPLMKVRGIEAADRLLADARKIYESQPTRDSA